MKYIFTIICFAGFLNALSQKHTIRAAFWNLENLYDTINAPAIADNEFTPNGSQRWTSIKYQAKTQAIRNIITKLNADLLGVCEVENRDVIEDILMEGYDYIHFDSPDIRGIDVAILYKSSTVHIESAYTVTAAGTRLTRDLLIADLIINDKPLKFVVAHLPSRRSRNTETEKQRQQIINQIDSITHDNETVIVCGDFNRNPAPGILPNLYNATSAAYHQGKGSYAYGDVWHMYDQMFVSNNLRSDADVFVQPDMIQQKGRFKGYPAKFAPSDHFPVFVDCMIKK